MKHVAIGRRFLSEVRSQYEDWHAAFVREAFQNCVDAPRSTEMVFNVLLTEDGLTEVTFSNNGRSMDSAELLDKLLTLGETGKDHEGTVGGFGRAKELLYFCHKRYILQTGSLLVQGEGCGYELSDAVQTFSGTRSTVFIEGDHVSELISSFQRCVSYSQWRGKVVLNNEVISARTKRGKRRDWDDGSEWCRVYTNRSHAGKLLVRVGGVFMFSKTLWDYDHCVVCELDSSYETLTSNRDGLRYGYRCALDEFIEAIGTNRRKAFRPRAPKYTRYKGIKLSAPVIQSLLTVPSAHLAKYSPQFVAGYSAASGGTLTSALLDSENYQSGSAENKGVDSPVMEQGKSLLYGGSIAVKHDFIILNEACNSFKVPVFYDPGSPRFSAYSAWLSAVWAKCLVELHAMFEQSGDFSLGFLFSENDQDDGSSTEAMFEQLDSVGPVYYISPARLIQEEGGRPHFSPRWTKKDRWPLLSVAAHEFVHGQGFDRHNELFASRLTDVLGKVLDHKNRFKHCFKV